MKYSKNLINFFFSSGTSQIIIDTTQTSEQSPSSDFTETTLIQNTDLTSTVEIGSSTNSPSSNQPSSDFTELSSTNNPNDLTSTVEIESSTNNPSTLINEQSSSNVPTLIYTTEEPTVQR
jgi:hypothetical protein